MEEIKSAAILYFAPVEGLKTQRAESHVLGGLIFKPGGRREMEVEGHRAPALLRDGKVDLGVYHDRTGVEAFADGGLTFVPVPRNADAQDLDLAIEVRGGTARIKGLEVHELRSIWR